MKRSILGLVAAVTIAVGVAVGALAAIAISGNPSPSPVALGSASPSAPASATPAATPSPTASPTASPSAPPSPTPTPAPTPVLVAAPLTGQLVDPGIATRHVIAVMIDDQSAARPQSGLSSASVVWQAPAEGGIPRYVALFQEGNPSAVGPVRSSRLYFIAWASEWRSVYVHAGGSPQALTLLRSPSGKGKVVYDADAFRYEGHYLWRIKTRSAPHNLYTDGKNLRAMAKAVGGKAVQYKPAWTFAADAPVDDRPKGGTIVVPYLANRISYTYDRATNTYLRSVTGFPKQVDAASKTRIAPKNVVVMLMSFAPLNDGSHKHRLEATFTGSGTAWVATNGRTIKGTWRKKSMTAPTQFFGADGKPLTLTIGQTFVQVVPKGTRITIKDGKVPPPPPATGTMGSPGGLME